MCVCACVMCWHALCCGIVCDSRYSFIHFTRLLCVFSKKRCVCLCLCVCRHALHECVETHVSVCTCTHTHTHSQTHTRSHTHDKHTHTHAYTHVRAAAAAMGAVPFFNMDLLSGAAAAGSSSIGAPTSAGGGSQMPNLTHPSSTSVGIGGTGTAGESTHVVCGVW